jgi:hypothetical protein
MAVNREGAAAALFARLQTLCGATFNFYSRSYVAPNTLQPEQQPALFLVAEHYITKFQRGVPNAWQLYFSIIVYCRALQNDPNPEAALNVLINSVDDAVARLASEPATDLTDPIDTNLGGLVSRVTIGTSTVSGAGITLVAGGVSGQSAAVIPVEILITQ